jgi:hypothetical protein
MFEHNEMLWASRDDVTSDHVALGDLVVNVLATGPKFRRFKPGRGRWMFMGDKNL